MFTSTFGLRASSSLFSKSSVQNGDSKPHYYNSKVNSINCKRHLNKYLNLKQQFVVTNSNEKEVDFKNDKIIDKRVSNTVKCKKRFEINKFDKRVKDRINESSVKLNQTKFDKNNLNSFKISVNQLSSDHKLTGSDSNNKQQNASTSRTTNNQVIAGQENYADLINVRSIYRNNLLNQSDQGDQTKMSGIPFKPKKALILTKFSRLEYERRRLVGCTEDEVKDNVSF